MQRRTPGTQPGNYSKRKLHSQKFRKLQADFFVLRWRPSSGASSVARAVGPAPIQGIRVELQNFLVVCCCSSGCSIRSFSAVLVAHSQLCRVPLHPLSSWAARGGAEMRDPPRLQRRSH
ncbi:unnamed protein product [Prorocentrum cordatum]|uniref:Uncharacterized protein n=1 Tax=Prorocentrum cordatum TaxID=2364126 RepID=A0ABN9R5P5_9DINO|nr:unnamed protein product [Polarella glacialis]